jgi:carboxyl-terminal processing protease
MTSRVLKVLVAIEASLLIASLLFTGGAFVGVALPRLNPGAGAAIGDWVAGVLPASWVVAPPASEAGSPAGEQTLFRPFWQAWGIVHQEFVDQPVDDTKLMEGAIRGMMAALGDAHSGYMDPTEYQQANIPLQGAYEGIGAWVDTEAEFLTIISPMQGSPAEKAGLQAGDQVIAVDGQDVTGIPAQLVVRRVMGPAGTSVVLTIRREGVAQPFDVRVTRQRISVPSVQSKMLDQGIGYIQLSSFGEETAGDLRRALSTLLAQKPAGLILDLRGNGGGYLASAVDVASEFIGDGVVLTERFGDGHQQVYRANGDGEALDIPLVVLINKGSASASEIVAGAIQDLGRGKLVGEQSFGKGSVQNWHALQDQAGAVRVTIARWFTPKGRSIEGNGLQPDVTVPLTDADVTAKRDPQLDKAVEILLGQTTAPTPAAMSFSGSLLDAVR